MTPSEWLAKYKPKYYRPPTMSSSPRRSGETVVCPQQQLQPPNHPPVQRGDRQTVGVVMDANSRENITIAITATSVIAILLFFYTAGQLAVCLMKP